VVDETPSPGSDCRFSPHRGFDGLSPNGTCLVPISFFPFALSPSKGVLPFSDTLRWEKARMILSHPKLSTISKFVLSAAVLVLGDQRSGNRPRTRKAKTDEGNPVAEKDYEHECEHEDRCAEHDGSSHLRQSTVRSGTGGAADGS